MSDTKEDPKEMSISEEAEIRKAEALEKMAEAFTRMAENSEKLLEGLGTVLTMYIEKQEG